MGQFSFFIIFVKILIDNIVLVFAIQHESVIIIHICMYVCVYIYIYLLPGFPCGSAGKESACNVGDLGLVPGLRRSPGEGKGYPHSSILA